ncbi:hypothetical protein ACGK9U_00275 [Mariniflexile sp. HNIBRBA6329]|uniref:hypothetical protein n=1 Tax=Mariniflexile sp. HNIBRBA6329 TaxID=3373088 RepID=UPI00374533DA
MKINSLLIFLGILVSNLLCAQVGIGTTTPNASAILDMTSTTQGVLTPRMTTAQRIAISNPANGLFVYDTTENAFYFYKSSVWIKLDSNIRNNYKLIKSAADLSAELTAGGGTKYLLSSNTLYEINGTITLAQPIDLNNAYLTGRDTNEDILVKSGGTMFTGTTGGNIKNLTLTVPGGTLFSLTGATTQNLIFRDCIVSGCNSIGSISGFGVVFLSVVQFLGNTTGITYNNITNLLLSNVAWFGNNTGTFETYTGTFTLIEKASGLCDVNGTAVGIDVSSNPTVTNGVMLGVSFAGSSTTYIKKYTSGSFTGFNFNKNWSVNCPGIPKESDDVATGYYNMNGNATNTAFTAVNTPTKILGTTTQSNLFRVTAANNRLTYTGSKPRNFEIICTGTVDHTTGGNRVFAYYIYKNGVQQPSISAERRFVNNDIGNFTLIGSVFMNVNDYIEVWVENQTNDSSTLLTKLSVSLR